MRLCNPWGRTLSHRKGSHHLVTFGGETAALPCLLFIKQLQMQHEAMCHQRTGHGGPYCTAGRMLPLHHGFPSFPQELVGGSADFYHSYHSGTINLIRAWPCPTLGAGIGIIWWPCTGGVTL